MRYCINAVPENYYDHKYDDDRRYDYDHYYHDYDDNYYHND